MGQKLNHRQLAQPVRASVRPGRNRLAVFGAIALVAAVVPTVSRAATQAEIDRGSYLVTIGICGSCHTPKDATGQYIEGRFLAGGEKIGGLTTSNLTPDLETGLGRWTDDQIVDAIRNGKRANGEPVRPPMGVFFYRDLSDGDVRSIVAYLRTVPAVSNSVERLPSRGPAPSYKPVASVAEPDRGDAAGYGRYLAQTVAHCFQCHTPRKDGLPDLTRRGAGGNSYRAPGGGTVVSSNITPAALSSWTNDQVKAAIVAGVRPDGGRLVPVMDFDLYARMTPEDLNMVVGYLRTLPPVTSEK